MVAMLSKWQKLANSVALRLLYAAYLEKTAFFSQAGGNSTT